MIEMEISIRPETQTDWEAIRQVNTKAFGRATEAGIVEKMRSGVGFVPELSLVAEHAGEIIGHVLFSEARIQGENREWTTLALGPVAVKPEFQRQGVGGQMIRSGLERAAALGYGAVLLIGHPTYYPRFGFTPASRFGLKCAIPVPEDVFMGCLLRP